MDDSLFTNVNASFYNNVKCDKRMDLSIGRILNGIRICAYGQQINQARACLFDGDKQGYDAIKSQLPAVTFCGTFAKGHKAAECTHYNNILVIDIDKLDEILFANVGQCLKDDPYIAAFWVSPSGRGYKGLVCLDYDEDLLDVPVKDKHKMAFEQLFVYLVAHYDISLDASGKDICRLCYMSADSNIVVKHNFESFRVKAEEPCLIVQSPQRSSKNAEDNTSTIAGLRGYSWNEICGKATGYSRNGYNRALLKLIYRKLKHKNLSITESFENWVKVAFAIASSVHPEKGRELFLDFCRLDGAKHDEQKSEHLIWDAYSKNQGRCSINTIIYLARQKGIVLK